MFRTLPEWVSVAAGADGYSATERLASVPTPEAARAANELALNATTPKDGYALAFCPAASNVVVPYGPPVSIVVL